MTSEEVQEAWKRKTGYRLEDWSFYRAWVESYNKIIAEESDE